MHKKQFKMSDKERAYYRSYYAKNKEKIKQNIINYWKRKLERMQESEVK